MNKVTLMGRLTKDPEIRYGQSGNAVLGFTMAVDRRFQKEGEERQADFILCKAFGKTAENMAKFFKKGSLVAIGGRIQTGSYEKDGQKVYTTDVIVDEFFFTGKSEWQGQHTGKDAPGFMPIPDDGEADLPF